MKYTSKIFVTVDVVLFRKIDHRTEVLLIQRLNDPYKNYWALPGGFVDEMEDLETAAKRELFEETDIRLFQVKQLKAYGNPYRDPRNHTISIAHVGIIDHLAEAKAKDDAKSVDRKSTRLNSSHVRISYAVFCLKKKKTKQKIILKE